MATPHKRYQSSEVYERKLDRVMERLGVNQYQYDWGRRHAWVRFLHGGQWWQFEHSVEKSWQHGEKLNYGSDCFAQVVLTLEDLARATERGLYSLGAFLGEELRYLPAPSTLPECFRLLGFTELPEGAEEVVQRYRELAKVKHPDAGGRPGEFEALTAARDQALQYLGGNRG